MLWFWPQKRPSKQHLRMSKLRFFSPKNKILKHTTSFKGKEKIYGICGKKKYCPFFVILKQKYKKQKIRRKPIMIVLQILRPKSRLVGSQLETKLRMNSRKRRMVFEKKNREFDLIFFAIIETKPILFRQSAQQSRIFQTIMFGKNYSRPRYESISTFTKFDALEKWSSKKYDNDIF